MADTVNSVDEKHPNYVSNGNDESNPKDIKPLDMPVANPADPAAPSMQVSSTRQRISDIFTIFCAGFALISDGYQVRLGTQAVRESRKV